MDDNKNQKQVIANMALVIGGLNGLVNNWDDNTQELFENYGSWAIPSLDETLADFVNFFEFLKTVA